MVIRVDGNDYFVKRPQGSAANVKLADGSTHKYTRNNAPGTHRLENDLEMQTRVQRLVTKLNAGQERAQPLSLCFTLGSPALSASVATILTTEVDCADAGDRRQTGGARAKASTHEAFRRAGPAAQTPSPTRHPRLRGPPKATRTILPPFLACHRLVLGPAGRCPRNQPTSAAQRSAWRPLPCSDWASPRWQSRRWSTELTLTLTLILTLALTTNH